jgi:hypothetical protein
VKVVPSSRRASSSPFTGKREEDEEQIDATSTSSSAVAEWVRDVKMCSSEELAVLLHYLFTEAQLTGELLQQLSSSQQ